MLLDLWFCCENCYDKPRNCYDKPNEIKFLGPQKWGIFIGKGVRLLLGLLECLVCAWFMFVLEGAMWDLIV